MSRRTNIYIDGFNFYYGAIRGGPYKWLDLEAYFKLLRNDDEIRRIYYFTALVKGPTRENQLTYLKAVETLPSVRVVLGKFKNKQIRCRVSECTFKGNRGFDSAEEKRTDVHIALQIVQDAHEDVCDKFVIVSGDSDLVPAVNRVKNLYPEKKVFVYVPTRNPVRGAAVELRSAADKDKSLPLQFLKRAQFPARLPDGAGGHIDKPADW